LLKEEIWAARVARRQGAVFLVSPWVELQKKKMRAWKVARQLGVMIWARDLGLLRKLGFGFIPMRRYCGRGS
jgi:hypothetical protein